MTATMSKTSWFKRNGGKDQLVHKEAASSPTPHSTPGSSRINVLRALRITTGSLSSRFHPSSSSTIQSPSNSNAVPPYTSAPFSLTLPSSSSIAQHPPSAGSSSHPVDAVRPSQDDSFANPFHSAVPSSTSASSSPPRVNFIEASVTPSTGATRLPTGAKPAARRRVLSNPDAPGVDASEAPNVLPAVAAGRRNDSGLINKISPSTTRILADPSSSPPSASASGSGMRRRNTVSTAINTCSASSSPSLAAAAVTISNNAHGIYQHPASTSSRALRPVIDISINTSSKDKDRDSNSSSNGLDHQYQQGIRPQSGLALSIGSPSAILETFQDWRLNDHDDSDPENALYGRGSEHNASASGLLLRPESHGMQEQESASGAGGQPRHVKEDHDQLAPQTPTWEPHGGPAVPGSNVSLSGGGYTYTDEDDEAAPLQPPRNRGASTTALQFARGRTESESEGVASGTETPTPGKTSKFVSRSQSSSRGPVASTTAADFPDPPPFYILPNYHQPHQQHPAVEPAEAASSSSSPSKHSIGLPSWLGGGGSSSERTSQQHKRRSSNAISLSSPPPQSQGLTSARSSSSLTTTAAAAAAARPPSAASSLTSLERKDSSRRGPSPGVVSFGSSRIGSITSSSLSSLGQAGGDGLAAPPATVVNKPSLIHSISLLDLHEKRQRQIQQLRENNLVAPSVLTTNIGMGDGSNSHATRSSHSIMRGPSRGQWTSTPPILRHANSFDPPKSTTSSPASSVSNLPSVGTTGTSTTPTRSPGKPTPNLPPTSPPLSAASSVGIENPNVPASVFPMTGNPGSLATQRSFGSMGRFSSHSSATASTTNSSVGRTSRSDSQGTSLTSMISPISPVSAGPSAEFQQNENEAAGEMRSVQERVAFVPGKGSGTAAFRAQLVAQDQNVSPTIDLMASVSFGRPHDIGENGQQAAGARSKPSASPDLSRTAAASSAPAGITAWRAPTQTHTGNGRVPMAGSKPGENRMRNRSTTMSTAITASSAPVGNSHVQGSDSTTEHRTRSATVASSSLISFLPSFDSGISASVESMPTTNSPISSVRLGLEGPPPNHPTKFSRRSTTTETPSLIPSLVQGTLGGLAVPSRPTKTPGSLPAPPRSRSARPSTTSAPLVLAFSGPSDSATVRPTATSRKVSSASSLPVVPAASANPSSKPSAPTFTPASVSLSPAPRRQIQIRARKNSTRSAASTASGGSGSKLDTVTENSKAAQQLRAALSRKPSSDAVRTTLANTTPPAVVATTRPLNLRKRPSFLDIESESDVTSGDDFLDLTDAGSSVGARSDDQATVKAYI